MAISEAFSLAAGRDRESVSTRAALSLRSATLPLFAIALLSSASLIFVLEPLFARMVLPLFGGAPAVWATCVVFYQLALVAGYLYSHGITRWLQPKTQVVLQIALMLAAFVVLPLHPAAAWMPRADQPVVPGMLLMLAVSVGLPFFAVSTIGPLLQQWFSRTGHRHSSDPYFLYAASNLGSFLGLISYPIVIEPNLRVVTQSQLWALGYVVLIALVALCGVLIWRAGTVSEATTPTKPAVPTLPKTAAAESVGANVRLRLRWLALSAVPSSLMLSVTTYASTDIAAMPLLWIVPLALYLLTFVLAFARRQALPQWLVAGLLPLLIGASAFSIVTESIQPIGLTLSLHLGAFFLAAMVCHGELANSRPDVSRLTEFYLFIAVGGALGGLFNVLAAPLLFVKTLEYPLVLLLACLLRPMPTIGRGSQSRRLTDVAVALLPGVMLGALLASTRIAGLSFNSFGTKALVTGLPLLICFGFWPWPRRFALGLAGVFIAGSFAGNPAERVLYAERSFYGTHRVVDRGGLHILMHGSTNHGAQTKDLRRRMEPLTYYGRSGPIGQVLEQLRPTTGSAAVGVVGLGTASLAAYSRPGERWTFYEINPTVERIARDPALFTLLAAAGEKARVVLGDARLSLQASTDRYDILALDAFSSDAIPMHLISREAIQLYAARLSPHGVMAFHISNRYLDLAPVLGDLAAAEGLVARERTHVGLSDEERRGGQTSSTWVVLARSASDFGTLQDDSRWRPLQGNRSTAWTDDFSNIWTVFHW